MIKVNNYEEWKKQNISETKSDSVIECPNCESGTVYGTCDCCDQETEHTCEECDGEGKLEFSELSNGSIDLLLSRDNYINQIKADIAKYCEWVGADKIEIFIDSGFTPWSSVYTKGLHIKEAEK